jgi:hypothetical protein
MLALAAQRPPPEEWLGAAIAALAPTPPVLPPGLPARLGLLLGVLRERRCLLVLDNLETVLEPGATVARYRAGYEGYGEALRRVAEAFAYPSAVALSADGAFKAAGMPTGEVRLWQVADRMLLCAVQGHTGPVLCAALARDGRLLASGGVDGMVRLWAAQQGREATPSGQLLATLEGHTGAVYGVALSEDGLLLASGGDDGAVRLWDAVSGICLHTMRADRRYERLNITGLTGVTEAQRAALLALGAFDGEATPGAAAGPNHGPAATTGA